MDGTRTTSPIDRRRFLTLLEAHGSAAVCAHIAGMSVLSAVMSGCGGLRYARSSVVGSQVIIERKELKSGTVLVDGPDGELPVHVRQVAPDRVRALSTRCMHRGCQVDAVGDGFVCPCHGSQYAADGAVLAGPTELPLVEYRTTVEGERVIIHLDAPVARASRVPERRLQERLQERRS